MAQLESKDAMTSATISAQSGLDRFIGSTLKGALIVFGLATCLPILLTIDVGLGNRLLFRGELEPTPSVDLIIRHWGFMIFGIGVLMLAAAFLPWLRFATLVFAMAEKILLVALVIAGLGQPWGRAYLMPGILDGVIVIYCVLYFISGHGRPGRWVPAPHA
jgi:hypothetical protein